MLSELHRGNFVVHKSRSEATDQDQRQNNTVNKGDGAAIGLTGDPEACQRCWLHQRWAILLLHMRQCQQQAWWADNKCPEVFLPKDESTSHSSKGDEQPFPRRVSLPVNGSALINLLLPRSSKTFTDYAGEIILPNVILWYQIQAGAYCFLCIQGNQVWSHRPYWKEDRG